MYASPLLSMVMKKSWPMVKLKLSTLQKTNTTPPEFLFNISNGIKLLIKCFPREVINSENMTVFT